MPTSLPQPATASTPGRVVYPTIGPISNVARLVAKECGVAYDDIVGDGRSHALSEKRQLAMWVARQATRKPHELIGRVFGGRDRVTVHYNVRRASAKRRIDPAYKEWSDNLLRLAAGQAEARP